MASGKGETAGGRGRERGGGGGEGGGVNMEPPSPPRSGRSAVAPHQPAPAPPPSLPSPSAAAAPRHPAERPSWPRAPRWALGIPPPGGGSGRGAERPEGRTPRVPGRPVPGRSLQAQGGVEGGEADSAPSRLEELCLPRRGRAAGAARVRSSGDCGLRRGRRPQTGAAPVRRTGNGGLRRELLPGWGLGMAASDKSCSGEERWGWRPLMGAAPSRCAHG